MIAEVLVALLLLASGVAALVAAIGLWRLPDFFLRLHAPVVCTTLGTWSVALASVLHFSQGTGQLALHAWLVVVILAITAPVTTALLARAALFRSRQAGEDVPPSLGAAAAERPDGSQGR
jgi:multicomponent K+:H+ antiporter subunit G